MMNRERVFRQAVVGTLLTALGLLVGGCAGGGRVPEDRSPPPVAPSAAPEYRVGAGDVVAVDVGENPDLSVRVTVRPDGHVPVPLAGEVPAARRTPGEIAADTERRLRRFIRRPKVSIAVTALDSAEFRNRVRVVGGVAEPKWIAHRGGMTVLDLVLEAGGVNEFAAPGDARLYRIVSGERRSYPLLLDGIPKDGAADANFPLLPGGRRLRSGASFLRDRVRREPGDVQEAGEGPRAPRLSSSAPTPTSGVRKLRAPTDARSLRCATRRAK